MTDRSFSRPWLVSCVALMLSASSLLAYEAKPVTKGGTIKGTVKFAGDASSAKLEVTKDKTACGLNVPDESLLVHDGLLENAVVSIDGITAGKEAAAGEPALSNESCRFVPHVQTIQVGDKLAIHNADPILHNTHGTYEDGKTAFNLALPIQDQTIAKRIKKPGVIAMNCDAGHTWMSAYVIAFEHPYHAVTGEDGSFTLTDVPPGKYTLSIWHESLAPKKVEVTVAAGETATIEVELAAKS